MLGIKENHGTNETLALVLSRQCTNGIDPIEEGASYTKTSVQMDRETDSPAITGEITKVGYQRTF